MSPDTEDLLGGLFCGIVCCLIALGAVFVIVAAVKWAWHVAPNW